MTQPYPNVIPNTMHTQAAETGAINTPPEENFNTQAMQGSMQQFLADNLGQYVVIEFLIGTQSVTRKEGILYAVGRSVVTLFEEQSQTFVVCDIFSVKFVTFYLPGRRPVRMAVNPNGARWNAGMCSGMPWSADTGAAPGMGMGAGMGMVPGTGMYGGGM